MEAAVIKNTIRNINVFLSMACGTLCRSVQIFLRKIAECVLALQVEGLKIFAEITIGLSGMCYFTENCSKFLES